MNIMNLFSDMFDVGGGFVGFIFTLMILLFIPILVALGFYLAGLWKIFKKADRNGWEAIVPFYNTWVLSEISGTAWWYPLIIIISNIISNSEIVDDSTISIILVIAAFVSNFFIFYNLSIKFHKGVGFSVLMTFFPFIMVPIMGFSKNYQYDKNAIVSQNGPIGYTNSNTSAYSSTNSYDYTSKRYCQYCGREINNEARFCGNCGNEIK